MLSATVGFGRARLGLAGLECRAGETGAAARGSWPGSCRWPYDASPTSEAEIAGILRWGEAVGTLQWCAVG